MYTCNTLMLIDGKQPSHQQVFAAPSHYCCETAEAHNAEQPVVVARKDPLCQHGQGTLGVLGSSLSSSSGHGHGDQLAYTLLSLTLHQKVGSEEMDTQRAAVSVKGRYWRTLLENLYSNIRRTSPVIAMSRTDTYRCAHVWSSDCTASNVTRCISDAAVPTPLQGWKDVFHKEHCVGTSFFQHWI